VVEPNESLVKRFDQSIKLDAFEGPLDLLLYLIRRNEIDIYDIPIELVTQQYLEILYDMEELSLDIAGEFFVMAATLMQIKSRMLLPKEQQLKPDEGDQEEDIDPRWELVEQLIEYKKFKEATETLQELIDLANNMIPREYDESGETPVRRPLKKSDKLEVWNSFNQVLRRLSEKITIGNIDDESVTVADRMEFILNLCEKDKKFSFKGLFPEGNTYSLQMLVSTFLAILELTRLGRLSILQTDSFEDIECEAREGSPVVDDVTDEDLLQSDFDAGIG
jgi:segregation and condensation protein A